MTSAVAPHPASRARPPLLGPWLIVAVVALAYLGGILASHAWDPLSLANIGTRFFKGDAGGSEGYDGQFNYFIAVDPLGAAPQIDAPAYRYQRILYPLLARALALGRPRIIPWTLPLINLLALLAGVRLTERLLLRYGASRWFALAYGLYAGQLLSLRLDVSEPLAQCFIMLGVWWGEEERWPLAGVAFALAGLTKETALVAAAGYLAYLLLTRRWRALVTLGALAGLPCAGWQVVLRLWLGQWGVGSGGAGATPFEIIPFGGFLRIAGFGLSVFALFLVILGPLLIGPIVAATIAGLRALWRRPPHPFTLMLLAQCAALIFLPFSSWREMLAMLRLSVGFVAGVLLFAGWRGSRRALLYAQVWIVTLVFLFKE